MNDFISHWYEMTIGGFNWTVENQFEKLRLKSTRDFRDDVVICEVRVVDYLSEGSFRLKCLCYSEISHVLSEV